MDDLHRNRITSGIERNVGKILQIGHHSIINSNYKNKNQKIAIYGLGSCVAPIIFDKENKVAGISHILLPSAKGNSSIVYLHKYADLSIKNLVRELIAHGAKKENLVAVIVGGANIFRNEDWMIGSENVKAVKEELNKLKIKIIKKEIGGSKGRIIIFDPHDFSVYIKITGEKSYKIL